MATYRDLMKLTGVKRYDGDDKNNVKFIKKCIEVVNLVKNKYKTNVTFQLHDNAMCGEGYHLHTHDCLVIKIGCNLSFSVDNTINDNGEQVLEMTLNGWTYTNQKTSKCWDTYCRSVISYERGVLDSASLIDLLLNQNKENYYNDPTNGIKIYNQNNNKILSRTTPNTKIVNSPGLQKTYITVDQTNKSFKDMLMAGK